jgi:hypothetical protein
MQKRTAAAIFGVLMLSLAGCSTSSEPPAASTASTPPVASGPIRGPDPPVITPLVGSVLTAPIPVPATDGKVHLSYEVQLTNVLAQEATLTSLVHLSDHFHVMSTPDPLRSNGLPFVPSFDSTRESPNRRTTWTSSSAADPRRCSRVSQPATKPTSCQWNWM